MKNQKLFEWLLTYYVIKSEHKNKVDDNNNYVE